MSLKLKYNIEDNMGRQSTVVAFAFFTQQSRVQILALKIFALDFWAQYFEEGGLRILYST